MNGVEILSSETIYEVEAFFWLIPVFAGTGLLISLICCIVSWIDLGFDSDHIGAILASVAIGAYLGLGGAIMSEHETDIVDHIEYKVTIDDSVSMNEFLDKYEILDQEGKIYTVRERE